MFWRQPDFSVGCRFFGGIRVLVARSCVVCVKGTRMPIACFVGWTIETDTFQGNASGLLIYGEKFFRIRKFVNDGFS